MFEGVTELVYREFKDTSASAPDPYLIEVGKVVINSLDVFFGRESVFNAFLQSSVVVPVVKQYGVCPLAITSCTSCFLEISLQ